MKASFKCGVCGERLTLTGTPDGIERARVMWLKGHEHPVATMTMSSTEVLNSIYDPPAVIFETPLEVRAGSPMGLIDSLEVLE